MEQVLFRPQDITKKIGVTYKTLWNWIKTGKIITVRTPNGRHLIPQSELEKLHIVKPEPLNKLNIIYARVSNTKQRDDLLRQITRLQNYASSNQLKIDLVLNDIGSGMNFKRKKFLQLLKLIFEKKIETLIIENKDRLCRFAFEIFEQFQEPFNFKIVVVCQAPTEQEPFEHELTQDLISIIHHFSMKLYSNRRNLFKKLAQELK
jgi:predicted site-specific integrase-resolvase